MASDVVVPEVGELGMEVTFVRWLKSAGDDVAVGDALFELDTEKTTMVVEAYAAGTLADLRATDGDTVLPRDVIGRILSPGETAVDPSGGPPVEAGADPRPELGRSTSPQGVPASPTEDAPPIAPPSGSPGAADSSADRATGSGLPPMSPRARRLARELAVDPAGLVGTGPDGLVTESDVRAAAGGGNGSEDGSGDEAVMTDGAQRP